MHYAEFAEDEVCLAEISFIYTLSGEKRRFLASSASFEKRRRENDAEKNEEEKRTEKPRSPVGNSRRGAVSTSTAIYRPVIEVQEDANPEFQRAAYQIASQSTGAICGGGGGLKILCVIHHLY